MDEIKCGTFKDWSFGGQLRQLRVKRRMTMREYCRQSGEDCGNVSKYERSELPPPKARKVIERMTKILKPDKFEMEFMCSAAFNWHLSRLRKDFE